ncbi:RelE family toxin-antitoxin system [Klebsiella pneumoniae]|uniref:ead/Ea22-like family protein n=1 Tax=Klebsiella pneumoniae TaxID=573 RepID=UPI001083FE75|nr:ead/Ea22-like family protein [Klebsiella pneumoniae]VGB83928.1 RelE family toxin-antitoxin system [Klebsiella pneumoniae]
MTDITELALSLKAAAEKATPGRWEYYPGNTSIEYNVDSMDEDQGSIVYVDSGDFTQAQTDRNGEFIALANPASILALVEALEKAQQVDEELCKLLPPGAEYMDPPDGGDVTPLEGVRRMVADYRQRIAELREWNAGLAQESFERQQRISELLEGKVGNALLERENHHVEVVGKLAERIAELEESHAQVIQSRDHYKRMLEEGLEQLAESRTVTVKLPDLRQIVSGDRYVWSDGVYNYSQDVKAILAAAGIKVEAE